MFGIKKNSAPQQSPQTPPPQQQPTQQPASPPPQPVQQPLPKQQSVQQPPPAQPTIIVQQPPPQTPKSNPGGLLSFPYKIFSAIGNMSSILVIVLAIAVGLALVTARSKILSILDSIDEELYTIQETKLTGTLRVTKGVTVGTELPVGEVMQKLNALPDSVPINTNIPLNTQTNLDTDFKLNTSLPFDFDATSSIELPPLGTLETISIPIETTAPLNTTVPIDTTLPINTTLPLQFDIPVSDQFDLALDSDLDLETTIPVNAEIPMEFDIGESNISERMDRWHEIINTVRKALFAKEKTRADFDIIGGEQVVSP